MMIMDKFWARMCMKLDTQFSLEFTEIEAVLPCWFVVRAIFQMKWVSLRMLGP